MLASQKGTWPALFMAPKRQTHSLWVLNLLRLQLTGALDTDPPKGWGLLQFGRMKYTLGLTLQPPSSLHLHVARGTAPGNQCCTIPFVGQSMIQEIICPSKCSPATEVWASATRYKTPCPSTPKGPDQSREVEELDTGDQNKRLFCQK